MRHSVRKGVSIVILVAFMATTVKTPANAQLAPWMPKPGEMVHLSADFTPAHLKGLVIHPENPLKFDFIIYKGDERLSSQDKQVIYKNLIKYFMASLAVPDDNQWVNLSPYEKNRVIEGDFGKTEMGRDLLAQDYLLKQITASLIYPEDSLGKKFWDKVYSQAQQQFGSTAIPVNTFNKVWIVPADALVYESGNTAYVLKNHLKVMLEEDYMSLTKHSGIKNVPSDHGKGVNKIGSQIVREIVLPALEKEVNEGKNFANLRQVYSGMILAAWYKRALKESLLGRIYADKAKVKGIDQNPKNNEKIYQQYLKAYKKGVFNYIKEDTDKYSKQSIPRKYFSGGATGFGDLRANLAVTSNSSQANQAMSADINKSGLDAAHAVLAEQKEADSAMILNENQVRRIVEEKGVLEFIKVLENEGLSLVSHPTESTADKIIVVDGNRIQFDVNPNLSKGRLFQIKSSGVIQGWLSNKFIYIKNWDEIVRDDFMKRIVNVPGQSIEKYLETLGLKVSAVTDVVDRRKLLNDLDSRSKYMYYRIDPLGEAVKDSRVIALEGKIIAIAIGQKEPIKKKTPLFLEPRLDMKNSWGDLIVSASLSSDGNKLVILDYNGRASLLNTRTGEEIEARVLTAGDSLFYVATISPDGKLIATIDGRNALKLWDMETQKVIKEMEELRFFSSSFQLTFSPDSKTFIVQGSRGEGLLFDIAHSKPMVELRFSDRYTNTVFSPDGQKFALVEKYNVIFFDTRTGKELHRLGMKDHIHVVTFSPDGKKLVVGFYDGGVKQFDIDSNTEEWFLNEQRVQKIGFTKDGTNIVTVNIEGEVRIWNANNREKINEFQTESRSDGPYLGSFLAEDNQSIVRADKSKIRIYDIPIATLKSNEEQDLSVEADEETMTIVGSDGQSRGFEKRGTKWEQVSKGPSEGNPNLRFKINNDGQFLTIGDPDGTGITKIYQRSADGKSFELRTSLAPDSGPIMQVSDTTGEIEGQNSYKIKFVLKNGEWQIGEDVESKKSENPVKNVKSAKQELAEIKEGIEQLNKALEQTKTPVTTLVDSQDRLNVLLKERARLEKMIEFGEQTGKEPLAISSGQVITKDDSGTVIIWEKMPDGKWKDVEKIGVVKSFEVVNDGEFITKDDAGKITTWERKPDGTWKAKDAAMLVTLNDGTTSVPLGLVQVIYKFLELRPLTSFQGLTADNLEVRIPGFLELVSSDYTGADSPLGIAEMSVKIIEQSIVDGRLVNPVKPGQGVVSSNSGVPFLVGGLDLSGFNFTVLKDPRSLAPFVFDIDRIHTIVISIKPIDPEDKQAFLNLKDEPKADPAMKNTKGGIDFNAAHLNLQIKRDGKGVPLPMSQQNLENIRLDGLVPVIINITPITSMPVLSQLINSNQVANG